MEHTLHLWVPDPVDSECDGAHGGADKIVSRIVEGHCCREKRECLQTIIKEKVDSLVVQP